MLFSQLGIVVFFLTTLHTIIVLLCGIKGEKMSYVIKNRLISFEKGLQTPQLRPSLMSVAVMA